MIAVALERTKLALVRALELAFQTNSQFRWDPNPDASLVTIYKQWPKVEVKLPSIVVTVSAGEALDRTLGQELRRTIMQDVYLEGATRQVPSAYRFGGGFHPSATIEVVANDTMTRDRILDWVAMYFRWFFWDKFRALGLNLEGMRFGGDRPVVLGADLIYATSLTLELFTEWNHVISVDDATRLQGICITNIFTIAFDGTTG